MVKIIKIDDIDAINSISENGKTIDIGSYRSLQNHPNLKCFFDSEKKLSIAFTQLSSGQELPVHQHPMESLIIVINGEGEYFGEFNSKIKKGDIVIVPKNSDHGFKSDKGMECISVQNDGEPIYKNDGTKRAEFNMSVYDFLLEENNKNNNNFATICREIKQNINLFGDEFKGTLFGYIKRWSETFQTLLFLRQANTTNEELKIIFEQHMEEEIGHHKYLESYDYVFNENMEGFCAWFESQMSKVNDFEKTILMHMVLELAGTTFSSLIGGDENSSVGSYIDLHSDLDEDHSLMGREQVKLYCQYSGDDVIHFNSQCWAMFNSMFSHILNQSKIRTGVTGRKETISELTD